MYSQPTARRKQRLAKFSAAIIFSVGLLAALLLLAFLLGTVVNGVGSFNYPLMIEKGSSIRFIPLYSYFFQSLVLYLLGIISLLALVTFLSSLTSKASLVLVLTFILSLGGTIGIESFMAGPNYWPYSLANSWHFIRSYGGIELNGHFWFACLSLLLFSAALLCGTEFNQKGRSLNQ